MACSVKKVLLGFEDEVISEKYKATVNYTTNKIGGKPDTPSHITLELPVCPLCQLSRPLVVQMYAPLENSPYHRTLYLFACINPNCWERKESWTCIRVQCKDKDVIFPEENISKVSAKSETMSWCTDADDWDDNNCNASFNFNANEENGNVIQNTGERISDEDEESCSFEESIRSGFGNLTVDDKNANVGAQALGGGAVGRLHSPAASAEIEGDEGEIISIDTPTMPQLDLTALLREVTPLPNDLRHNTNLKRVPTLQFVASFMTVFQESSASSGLVTDDHIKELLQEYHKYNDDVRTITNIHADSGQLTPDEGGFENYEKSNPAHGDKMFHHFHSKIQANPGQIIRYCRETDSPLLLQPLQDIPKKCQYCQGDLVFEFQLLPTIISKLMLTSDASKCSRLEFGTVLVYTCKNSCWSNDSTVKYETVIMQKEAV